MNIDRFKESLAEEVENSKDAGSICNMIRNHEDISKDAVIDDLVSLNLRY